MQHSIIAWPAHTSPVTLAFPSTGNLLVGSLTGREGYVTNISDSNGNTWLSAANTEGYSGGNGTWAQMVYAPNAATSPSLTNIRVTFNPACGGDCNLVLYDITGAAASPFDKAATASGNQTNAGTVNMVSLTPSASSELTVMVASINFHTINSILGTGYVLDSQVNAFDDNNASPGTQPSRLDMDNAFAHIYTASVSPLTFSFTATTRTSSPPGISFWGAGASA